jgi:putative sigma-54 modulation protein
MRIEVKGRNVTIDDELRRRAEHRFDKLGRRVSPLAQLELELSEERNPAISASQVAAATLYLKGATLRAKDSSQDLGHAIGLVADELGRQLERHQAKRRGRREAASRTSESPVPPAASA